MSQKQKGKRRDSGRRQRGAEEVRTQLDDSVRVHLTHKTTSHALTLVSQATPFAERGRVWSRCNHLVVAEERNYRPLRLGNKVLTSAKHVVT